MKLPKGFSLQTKKKEGQILAYIYRNDEKMPIAGTNFNQNTSLLDILNWAKEKAKELL